MKVELTKQQKDYIDNNYKTMTYQKLSEDTGLGISIVKRYMSECGYEKPIYRESKLTREQKDYIERHYPTEKSSEICRKLGVPYRRMQQYAMSKGIKKEHTSSPNYRGRAKHYFMNNNRPHDYNPMDYMMLDKEPLINSDKLYKSKYGKYHINPNYFESIDNEWKAYWLGFMYADGWVGSNGNSVGLALQRKD